MTLRRKRRPPPVCCGAEVAAGVSCPGCGAVAGRQKAPAKNSKVRQPLRRKSAKPRPARAPRPRKSLRASNPERRAKRYADDFGPLAAAVRQLRCAVVGCDRTPVDPAHVVSRAAGGGAWVWASSLYREVGNLAPLCRGHHTGAPGFPREHTQHQAGLRAFQQAVGLAVKLPGEPERPVARLAEVAEAIGDWFKRGAPGIEGAPC